MTPIRAMRCSVLLVCASLALTLLPSREGAKVLSQPLTPGSRPRVGALGRLLPRDGVRRVAGPSRAGAVIAELRVDHGDVVEHGQVIAVLDTHAALQARVRKVSHASDEAQRLFVLAEQLWQQRSIAASERDARQAELQMAEADLRQAEAELEEAVVRAPLKGQVIEVHTRAGERIGEEGIVEIGQTDQMYAVAEVYEDNIGDVYVGQRATITNPALPNIIEGSVERIGRKVKRLELLGDDPAARTDSRIVEVHIRLDNGTAAAGLTNAQVEVLLAPRADE